MIATLTRRPARLEEEERMEEFATWVRAAGYRAPTRDDLVPGAALLMLNVEHCMTAARLGISFSAISKTEIILDDEPVAPSKADPSKEVVFYHCVMPPWDGQCFVPLEDFTTLGYRKGIYANDTRWVVKA